MTASDTAMLALTLTGVGHMVWLGIQTLREAPSAQVKMNVARHPPAHPSHGHQSTKPQDLLAFLALLPQFTRQAAAPLVSADFSFRCYPHHWLRGGLPGRRIWRSHRLG